MDIGESFEWDENKSEKNRRKHGVDFRHIGHFDWQSAFTREDFRNGYNERRFVSIGPIRGRLHVVVWVERANKRRVISLRKANRREISHYEQA